MKTIFLLTLFLFILAITIFRLFSSHPPNPSSLSNPSYVSAFVRLNQPQNPVDQIIKKLYPEPEASLLSGILIGTKAQMPADFYNNLQKTGTLHMIALSGQNISLVIALIAYILKGFGKKLSSFITIITIIIFICFVGPSASVVRAGLMGGFVMLSIIFGRQYLAVLGLFISGLVMIVISPSTIFDIGWQLSFSATLGIILLSGKIETGNHKILLSRLANSMLFDLKTTLAAQLFTTPIVLYNFHNLSIVAPLTNVLILWTIPVLMYGGFGVALISLISPIFLISQSVSWPLYPLLVWFVVVVNWTASLPLASLTMKNFSLWMTFLYYGVLFLILAIIKTNSTHKTNLPN